MSAELVVNLGQVRRGDVGRVGGKNASLGEMIAALGDQGIRVPGGFATTAAAYWAFAHGNGIDALIASAMARAWPAIGAPSPRESPARKRYWIRRGASIPMRCTTPAHPIPWYSPTDFLPPSSIMVESPLPLPQKRAQ